MKLQTPITYTVGNNITKKTRRLTCRLIRNAINDVYGWVNYSEVLKIDKREGFVRQVSVTQWEWFSEEKIEELRKLNQDPYSKERISMDDVHKQQRRFFRFAKELHYIQFMQEINPSEITGDNLRSTIRTLAWRACEYLEVYPTMYIPVMLKKNSNVHYYEHLESLFIEQIFELYKSEEEYLDVYNQTKEFLSL